MKIIKKILFVFIVLQIVLLSKNEVYASDAKVTISTTSVEEGVQVKVNVKVSSAQNIGISELWIQYDKSVITYYSGADSTGDTGLLLLRDFVDEGYVNELSRDIIFVGKKAGSTTVTIGENSYVLDFDTEKEMKITTTAGKVTVTAPVAASGDCTLKKLVVYGVKGSQKTSKLTLSPKFSSSTYDYQLSVEGDVDILSVSATPTHEKATVKVSGLTLSTGENVTTITVTAENGDKEIYYIFTTKAKIEETTEEEKKEEDLYLETTLGDNKFFILKNLDEVTLPEGFEAQDYTYNENKIQAGKGLSKNLIIFYMLDENKENGRFYIYEEETATLYPMINITTAGKIYTLVNVPKDFTVPEDFVETTITIDGIDTIGWNYGEASDFVYVYALNWDGNGAVYCYDIVEKTMQRVTEYANTSDLQANVELLQKQLKEERQNAEALKADIDELEMMNRIYIICMMILMFVILVLFIAWIRSKKKESSKDSTENETAVTTAVEEQDEAEEKADAETDTKAGPEENSETEPVKANQEISVIGVKKPETESEDRGEDNSENIADTGSEVETTAVDEQENAEAGPVEKMHVDEALDMGLPAGERKIDKSEAEDIIDRLLSMELDDLDDNE